MKIQQNVISAAMLLHTCRPVANACYAILYGKVGLTQGKSEHSDWLFLGRDFAIRTVSMEIVTSCAFFCFSKLANSAQSMAQMPYNKLLTNLASSSHTYGLLTKCEVKMAGYWQSCSLRVDGLRWSQGLKNSAILN